MTLNPKFFNTAETAAMDVALTAALGGPRGANPLVGAVVLSPGANSSPLATIGELAQPTPRPMPFLRHAVRVWTLPEPPWWSPWSPATTWAVPTLRTGHH